MIGIKKYITILGVLIILSSIGVGGYFVYQKGLLTLEEDTTIKPTKVQITNISHDRFTVSWITEKPTQGVLVYGQSTKLEETLLDDNDQLTGQSQDHKLHHVTLTKLEPSTTYYFKIRSSEKNIVFDNSGEPYSVKTAPLLGTQPPTDIINGTVIHSSGKPATGSIVYVSIAGVTPLSTQVKKDGTWLISLSNARISQLTDYASYDPATTMVEISVQGESATSKVTTNTANDSPVPTITLGETYDFTKTVANSDSDEPSTQMPIEPNKESSSSSGSSLKKFPLEEPKDSSSSSKIPEAYPLEQSHTVGKEVKILNPAKDKEELYTTKPEFLGTGPANKVLTIEIHSPKLITGSTIVDKDGNWSFSPPENLTPGEHEIKISYVDDQGKTVIITKNFLVASSSIPGNYPAFESTPSATTTPRPTAKPTATPKPTARPTASGSAVRSYMPSTSSGVPQSGGTIPTAALLLLGLGFILSGFVWKNRISRIAS